MGLQHEEVLRASAAWTSVWFPAHAGHADLGWLEYYLVDGVGTVMQVRPGAMTAQELVPRVIAELRDQRAAEVQWLVGPQYLPAGVGEVLRAMGASVVETVDICAHPLDRGLSSGSLPPGTKTEPVRTRADTALYERVSALAWGYPPPSEQDIDRTFDGQTEGMFVGYWQQTPAGAGGYGLAGDVARFWGTAVMPRFRGRGVYRALVHTRTIHARDRGARFALVHARPTSSPILQRLGFAVYGHQILWSIRTDS